ncbi:MAG: hypothetical protein M1834_007466 [Cirrosporium novae-zelandiae]|nr:MAG: hypothetical protein M1834_007466 [Cirrosporium novae-zelandiae]
MPEPSFLVVEALFHFWQETRAVVLQSDIRSYSRDADFDSVLSLPPLSFPPDTIPRTVHFVFVDLKPLTWMEFAAVQGAHLALKAETINIWVPDRGDPLGKIWEMILDIPGVRFRRIEMPDSVYGHELKILAHISDIVRMKAMYEEGGIYLDTNLVALRPVDEILNNPDINDTVMALEGHQGICNAMIMSKPRAPFMKQWMQQYIDFDDNDWKGLSVLRPFEMYLDGTADHLSVLDDHSWFYPMYYPSDRGLMTMWLGKSWHDINRSYGVHFWPWLGSPQRLAFDPEVIRLIDTPLFCTIRHYFDNLDSDGYFSVPASKNPNCTIAWMSTLAKHTNGLFSLYDLSSDNDDRKWVDTSGNNLHGWAPHNVSLSTDPQTGLPYRQFVEGAYSALPVPADWDPRQGSFSLSFKVDRDAWFATREMGLLKIRFDRIGSISLGLESVDYSGQNAQTRFQWQPDFEEIEESGNEGLRYEGADWRSDINFVNLFDNQFHEITMTWDRLAEGFVKLFIDGKPVSSTPMSLVPTQKVAQEIWLNALNFQTQDLGFRGLINGLKMYSSPLSADVVSAQLFPKTYNRMLPPSSFSEWSPSNNNISPLNMASLPCGGSSYLCTAYYADFEWRIYLLCCIATVAFGMLAWAKARSKVWGFVRGVEWWRRRRIYISYNL